MKALARSYVWWPGIDKQIEERVKKCRPCQETRHFGPKAPTHPWEVTRAPWSRLHLDFAGRFQGRLFLIIVDSYSKWLEVLPVVAQSSKILICELRRVFATHGLPDTIASDNGSPFTSSEFGEFLRRNAIRHARVAPYHPSSNGQAERMIQTAKDALRRMQSGDLSQQLASFLLSQHTLPCVTTGRSPAELLMNRRLRSRLDRLHPDWSSEHKREIEDNAPKTKPRLLDINEPVLVRTFSPGQNWTPATITHSTGPVSYRAQTTDGKIVHRQVDHILKDYSSGAEHTEIGPAESSSPEQETERPNETNEQTPLVAVAPPIASRPRRTVDRQNGYKIMSSKRMMVLCIVYDWYYAMLCHTPAHCVTVK
ncbi:hypothetical protein M513_11040 [Trichuris suis]|uniref:RNA-directed DNA polymerase n=1 Tax=Trichuris suis TaxID=68888 RepID=A0A085LT01_9BILA|nr:hypothetical protein M513_11040 [Trichuris suis]